MGLFKGYPVTIWNSTKILVYIPERVLRHPKYVSLQGLDKTTSSGTYWPQPFCDLCGNILGFQRQNETVSVE